MGHKSKPVQTIYREWHKKNARRALWPLLGTCGCVWVWVFVCAFNRLQMRPVWPCVVVVGRGGFYSRQVVSADASDVSLMQG